MTNKMKPWTCKHGHILGYIRWNGSGLPQLMLLREPLDMTADQPDVVDLLGPLDGQINVRCKVCDDLRFWEISVESLLVLVSEGEAMRLTLQNGQTVIVRTNTTDKHVIAIE